MNWQPIKGILPMEEAKPESSVRYFIVDGGESWTACLSIGIGYKFVRTLKVNCESANEAKRVCEQNYQK